MLTTLNRSTESEGVAALETAYIITGASSGLGKAIVNQLPKDADIVTLSRTEAIDPFNRTAGFHWLKCDLSDPQSINNSLEQIQAIFPGTSKFVFIANAGYGQYGRVGLLHQSLLERQYQVNVYSVYQILKGLNEHSRHDVDLLAVSSVYGAGSQINKGVYASSKMALEGLVESYQLENPTARVSVVRPAGIKTNYLSAAAKKYPSNADTDYQQYMLNPSYHGFSTPEHVASKIVSCLERQRWPAIISPDLPSRAFQWLMKWLPQGLRRKALSALYLNELKSTRQ